MALFQGEEMIDVTTPDGRTFTLPRSIVPASMLPQQQIAAPTGAAPFAPPPQAQPELATPSLAPPDTAPGIVEMGEPDVTPVVDMAPEVVTANPKRVANARKQQAAYAASPDGQLDAVKGQQNAAVNAQKEALLGARDVQFAEDRALEAAVGERNKSLAQLDIKQKTDIQKITDEREAKTNELIGMRKKFAGTKIDRKLDHPVLASIMAGLAGLGAAMNGKPVDTLEILYNAIDRKVAAQTADLDQMAKVYGFTKDELEMIKEKGKSKLELHSIMFAAEVDKAKRTIEEVTARSASEKTKANAKQQIAQLDQWAAEKTQAAVQWGLDFNQKDKHQKQQIGLGYANLGETRRSNMANEQIKRESNYFDYQQALAAAKAKGDELSFKATMEAEKEVRETGLKGVDNEYLLTPAGRSKMEEAKQLEADAAALESNPDVMARSIASDKVALLKQKAAILRGQARSTDVVKARDGKQAGDLSLKYAAGQSMMDNIDEIKMLYDQVGRGYITKDKAQQEIESKIATLNLQIKEVTGSGAWDKGLATLYKDITGGNPTSGWDVGVVGAIMNQQMIKDPEGFKKRLDSIATDVGRSTALAIGKNSTYTGPLTAEDLFTRKTAGKPDGPVDKASAALSQGSSAQELQQNAEKVGVTGKVARAVGYPFSPSHADEAAAAESSKYLGLSKAQEPEFDKLLRAAKTGDKAAADELIAKVANESASRPAFAVPLLHNLREHAPKLYAAARAAVPKGSEVDKQMEFEENNRVGAAVENTAMTAAMVINSLDANGRVTDVEGRAKLARIAGDPAHPDNALAKKALLDIVHRSGTLKTLPQGSVFREGR